MSAALDQILEANAAYAKDFGEKGRLKAPPARGIAILTCMDARLDPAKFAGLDEGEAHVIRNAGGRASEDAIRSLVVSYKLLRTQTWLVIHHTDCGMTSFTDDEMQTLLASSLEPAEPTEAGWRDLGGGSGSPEGAYMAWLPIGEPDAALRADVERIRNHPLVPARIAVHGLRYDCATGKLGRIIE